MRGPCMLGRMTRLTGALSCLMPGVFVLHSSSWLAGWLTGTWYGSWELQGGKCHEEGAGAKLVRFPLIVSYHPDLLNPGSIPLLGDRSDGFNSKSIVDIIEQS
ncbi:hypothetical protein TWF173_008151 [Orbilia oligospora]|uniref:Uncharacterized protein n=1 Tax=Orbilia oligospora TaxID=2813651 RepID=A0A7C8VL18_ORBOL|nr:hypothetical protein TWF970_006871 [Orbilia oligospora]KAF3311706.1 hypothetical protein TWF173_008151 [Orbilia oligospora]